MDPNSIILVDQEIENSIPIEPSTSHQEIATSYMANPKPPDELDSGQENVKEDIATGILKGDNKKSRLNELDKFKRRLIRAVARLMYEEKKPENEIWTNLRMETSCDCKLLWKRMSALTIKKLRRLIVAEDYVENITPIAQLSVTDWLLFDLVLVHEDVDVIGQDISQETEPTVLKALFKLVVKYNIEYLSGDKLTVAWYYLTREYNSRGRKCSPMLLQRRWYQMKEQVRSRFYNFWFTYRGSARKLEAADKYKPSELQMEIVGMYSFIVTKPFKSWDQQIVENKVSLPSDFERLQLSRKKKITIDNEPDLELIEPQVETIDLGVDTDDEESRDSLKTFEKTEKANKDQIDSENTESNDTSEKIVKTEVTYDLCDENEVSTLESMYIPLESNINSATDETNQELDEFKDAEPMNTNELIESTSTTDVDGVKIETKANIQEETAEEVKHADFYVTEPPQDIAEIAEVSKDFEMLIPKITSVTSTADIPLITIDDDDDDDVHNEINDILEKVADKYSKNKSDSSSVQCITTEHRIEIDKIKTEPTLIEKIKEVPIVKEETLKLPIRSDETVEVPVCENKLPNANCFNSDDANDLHLIEGIELEDDGIVFYDEDEDIREVKMQIKVEKSEEESEELEVNDDTPKIDLKLLLNPVVYTKKLDDMDVFRFIDYTVIKDKRIIENAASESKPVDKKSVNMKEISQEYRKSIESDQISDNDSEYSSDNNYKKLKSTSWVFRKPRTPTYNPIQLCKNPDFNTRLKWLTAGFLSLERNRELLKECKPLTIDVSKAFESKLVNGTLCIENSDFPEVKPTLINSIEKTVVPSESYSDESVNSTTVSIIPETITSIKEDIKPEVHDIERKKVINLPNLDQIRRTNEKLLIAEVTPLQVSNILNTPPVTIVKNDKEQPSHNFLKQEDKIQTSQNLNNIKEVIVNNTNIVNNIPSPISLALENKAHVDIAKEINEPIDISSEKRNHYSENKRESAKKSNKISKPPPKVNHKLKPVNVTWKPKLSTNTESEIPTDRLLALDTVERIISVCKGITIPLSKKNQKKFLKRNKKGEDDEASQEQNYNKKSSPGPSTIHDNIPVIDNATNIETVTKDSIKDTEIGGNDDVKAPKISKIDDPTNDNDDKFPKKKQIKPRCCWARERIEILKKKLKQTRLRHLCPQYSCHCCCRIEYCTMIKQIKQNFQPLSSTTTGVASSKIDELYNAIYKIDKVSIGVNTVFNNDFEQCYAAFVSMNNRNIEDIITNQPVATRRTSLRYNKNSLGTQTIAYKDIEHLSSSESVASSVNILPNINKVALTINPVQQKQTNVPTVSLQTIMRNAAASKGIKPKCKTNIHHRSNLTPIVTKNQELKLIQCDSALRAVEKDKITSNKVVILNNKIKKNLSKNPICLGKNKILLCSSKPLSSTNMMDVTHLIAKPKLSKNILIPQYIDPNQNASGPTLIPKGVHLVLLPSGELVLSMDPGVELDQDQIANIPSLIYAVQQQLKTSFYANNVVQSNVTNDVIQLSDDESSLENNKEKDILNSAQMIGERDSVMKKVYEKESVDVSGEELINNNEKNSENTDSEINPTVEKDTNILVDDSNTNTTNDFTVDKPKKTILSDLMEMSGISLEDTTITDTENVGNEQPQLTCKDVSTLQETNADIASVSDDKNQSELHPILHNPFVQSALLKCPDLNIVSSFDELKHVYETKGQFYKMDIETGFIVPINVSVKRQKAGATPRIYSKSVIDLTEDDENQDDNETCNTELTSDENNTESPMDVDLQPKSVKPIKLFKAVHPSILKHSNKFRIFNTDNVFKRKHEIKIKNLVPIGEMKTNLGIPEPNIQKEASDSESDDEPLALMAKRIKTPVETKEKEEIVKTPDEKNQEEELPVAAVSNSNETPLNESTHLENKEDIIDSDKLQPLFLQYSNDESSEEDCILGV